MGAAVGHVLAGFFIVLFSTYFFLADGERIWAWFVRLSPRASRVLVDGSGRVAWVSLTQFVRATVIVAATDAIGVMIVAAVLGVPFVMAIGVLVFLGAFVPMVGAFVAGTVAVLVALVDQGPVTALLMLGGVVLVQQIEGHVLQPFLMGRFVSVHPLGVIVAIGVGVVVAGIPGALVAVPAGRDRQRGRPAPGGEHQTGGRSGETAREGLRRRRRAAAGGGTGGRAAARARGPRPVVREPARDGPGGLARRRRDPVTVPGKVTVTLADIEAAREVLDGVTVVTPMQTSRWLSTAAGGNVHLKLENLQRTGSFKTRGAYLRISRLSEAERANGVVAASAGNHAQGVALSASLLGIKSTVFMPEGAPIPKVRATEAYGADIVFHGQYLDQALVAARAFAQETGAVLIHPFDHVDIVTGQGTCGLEIIEQVPDVKTVVVPTGGGGLLAGIAIAVKALKPDVRVVGVQAAGAAAYPKSLADGHPVALEHMRTIADGIAVGCPGQVTFDAVQEYVDDIVTVSEDSLSRAVLSIAERAKQVVEPAGAAGVAAMLDDPTRFETPAVVVLSGGNIDPLLLGKVIRQGMAAAGRYLGLRVHIPDLPGGLAAMLTELADSGANVIEVVHERISPTLHLNEVEVLVQLETRGPQHSDPVVRRLRDRGYEVFS